jgi:hypothetical protein
VAVQTRPRQNFFRQPIGCPSGDRSASFPDTAGRVYSQ